uniref:Uncharacterized protein n=1 Tax=Ciona intestinalis TaxID=7719 RepID=H2Y337_CIOIN
MFDLLSIWPNDRCNFGRPPLSMSLLDFIDSLRFAAFSSVASLFNSALFHKTFCGASFLRIFFVFKL